jgi:hypothetical protein
MTDPVPPAGRPGPRTWGRAGLLLTATILVVCLVPGTLVSIDAPPGSDKLGHAAGFAAFAFAWRRAGLRVLLVVLLGALLAAGTEALQAWLPIARDGDPLDVAADLAGVAAGLLLAGKPYRIREAGRESTETSPSRASASGSGRPTATTTAQPARPPAETTRP